MKKIIQSIQKQFIPDTRVEVFNIRVLNKQNKIVLSGSTTNVDAYKEILSQAKKNNIDIKDSIRLLPDAKLGEKNMGIVYNSMGTVHSKPRRSSETITQVMLGMPLKVLEKRDEWLHIQTPDRYIGWINGSVELVSPETLKDYNKQPKIIITNVSTHSITEANDKSDFVSDLIMGNMLVLKGEKGNFYHVSYPDGREAFVKKSDARKVSDWLKEICLTGESIENLSRKFMGVPYVWGGTSPKGLDCSGFTKTVYFNHGIILPRDASQQVLCGKLIDEKGDFTKCQKGDLVFFGKKGTSKNPKEKVTHVGIYFGNMRFIHASDYVRINSFDPTDSLYDEFNTNRYLRTKRIIGEVGTNGIEPIYDNELYQ